MHTHKGD